MRTLFVLIIGIGIGAGVYWYLQQPDANKNLQTAGTQLSNGMSDAREKLSQRISDIDTSQLKEELARTGLVVRKKTQEVGNRIVDATADARITAALKSKYAL